MSDIKIGWWWAPCCIHDLSQIKTKCDLDDALQAQRGDDPPYAGAWATLEEALNALIPKRGEDEFGEGIAYALREYMIPANAEIERLRGLLQEARDSVRKHWRGHVKGLERAIRLDRIDVIAIETKREAELRDLRDRIDCALGTANQPKESK